MFRKLRSTRRPSLSGRGVRFVGGSPDRETWSNWLSGQRWDQFITITFRQPVMAHRADQVLYSAAKSLREFNPEALFLATEQHLSTNLHIHGLYRGKADQTVMWNKLFKTYGRSEVRPPRDNADVAAYVSKYCVKNLGEYYFGARQWVGGHRIFVP